MNWKEVDECRRIQSIGFSLFYRMGPYSYLKQSNNLFFRISAGINI